MRKLLAVCIAALMAFAACGACAEGEILFRGIPWGSSYTEVLGVLPEGVEMMEPYGDHFLTPINSMMAHVSDGQKNLWDDFGFFTRIADYSTVQTVKVAGYDASDLRLFFAYTEGPDGKLDTEPSHCRLYYADYHFATSGEDTDIIQADLAAKMSSLYGEAFYSDGVYYWMGENGTVASLTRFDANFGNDSLYVSYGTGAADQWRMEAYEAAVRRDPVVPDNSTDGL